uniref:AT4G13220 protein n=1 Tax=Arabidopsis thaliana TaxID=3702 RepID=C0Z3H4_ARATH|nr:AT4G13220 [Arabidopsis thaliana]
MASSLSLNPSPLAPRFLQTLTQFPNSPFLSPCSVLKLKNASLLNLRTRIAPLQPQRLRSKTLVLSAQSSFLKVLRTAWNIGKDGIEAGTNLVPVSSL